MDEVCEKDIMQTDVGPQGMKGAIKWERDTHTEAERERAVAKLTVNSQVRGQIGNIGPWWPKTKSDGL